MASVTLKNLPDDLLHDLRKAAELDRRSLNQQVIHLLAMALRGPVTGPAPDVKAQLAAWRKLAGRWKSDVDAEEEMAQVAKARTRGRDVDL